jgi:transketolase
MAGVISMRDAYGQALVDLGASNSEVVVLSADVANSDRSYMFGEAYPDRFVNVGIAEQSLVDVAVGMAYSGRIPFVNTFAFLLATRALEMVRTHLCYGRANVKLMGAYGGLSDSFDGPTHHSICDLAIMRALPNMTIVVPSDPDQLQALLPQVAAWPGPVYMRLNRNEVPAIYVEGVSPIIGEAIILRKGGDVTLIAAGMGVSRALAAAEQLVSSDVQARVLDMHTIKPLDREAVLASARETGALVTVEEHSMVGGLGGAVAELVGEECPVPVIRAGIPDCFAETGPYAALLDRYGLSVQQIVRSAQVALQRKR